MLKATFKKYSLRFKQPAGTSRGVLYEKPSWILSVWDPENTYRKGTGECSVIPGLSIDKPEEIEVKLHWLCQHINESEQTIRQQLRSFPAICFGWEMAVKNLNTKNHIFFPSAFTQEKDTILINGLIWMGGKPFMQKQIKKKIAEGYRCIKMKIGAIDFDEEYNILKAIRDEFPSEKLMLRVDANGAFSYREAMEKMLKLCALQIHSIEQPIRAGQWKAMKKLCEKSPVDIALDEELTGVFGKVEKEKLLQDIRPQYIILKPSMLGGWRESEEWITLAEKYKIGWWVTSALESNIGLNAIAQWTYTLKNKFPQGLGTGQLFTNNFPSQLYIEGGKLGFRHHQQPVD